VRGRKEDSVAVVVRDARPGDAESLARIHTVSWREAYAGLMPADFLAQRVMAPAIWEQRLSEPQPRYVVLVAEVAGLPVGFAVIGPDDRDRASTRRAQLYAIYVLAEHWGAGVGYRLHEAGLAALADRGFTEVVLWVLVGNIRTIAFYERQGWRDDEAEEDSDVGGLVVRARRYRRSLTGAAG
jgi:GNAT superfamily N-acetyltransferase